MSEIKLENLRCRSRIYATQGWEVDALDKFCIADFLSSRRVNYLQALSTKFGDYSEDEPSREHSSSPIARRYMNVTMVLATTAQGNEVAASFFSLMLL
jgi:hypothetical protein